MNQQETIDPNNADIASPCVSICALDADDVCVGCHRTGQEISNWGAFNLEQKKAVMEKVRQREASSYI